MTGGMAVVVLLGDPADRRQSVATGVGDRRADLLRIAPVAGDRLLARDPLAGGVE